MNKAGKQLELLLLHVITGGAQALCSREALLDNNVKRESDKKATKSKSRLGLIHAPVMAQPSQPARGGFKHDKKQHHTSHETVKKFYSLNVHAAKSLARP